MREAGLLISKTKKSLPVDGGTLEAAAEEEVAVEEVAEEMVEVEEEVEIGHIRTKESCVLACQFSRMA